MSTPASHKKDTTIATTFSQHVKELRNRVIFVALIFLVLSAVMYSFRDILIAIVRQPLGDQELVYLTPAGGFSFIFSVTMYAAMVITAPFLVYQLYQFVRPALPVRVRNYSLRVVVASTVLMISGVLFGYFFAVPAALNFLTNFAGEVVSPNLTADSYLNFFMAYVAGLGILFQLPLLLIFWNWINPLKPGDLLKSQRFVIAGAFVVAAMITPTPDAFNQAMVASPIILIYQFGAIVVSTSNRRMRKAALKAQTLVAAKPAPKSTAAHAAVAQPVVAKTFMKRSMDMVAVQPPVSKPATPTTRASKSRPQRSFDIRPSPRTSTRPALRAATRSQPPLRRESSIHTSFSQDQARAVRQFHRRSLDGFGIIR